MTTTLIVDPVRAEIDEIIDFQEMLDEGLVHDPIPTENPVQMHVEDTERNIRAGIFLDLDDTTGALAGAATDPDALDNDGASSADL
jgi:ethanolamine ammonia-lyase large subunit